MTLAVKIIWAVAIIIETVKCQGIGNSLSAGSKNAPYGNKYPNGLVSPGLGNPGLGTQGLGNQGLAGPGLGGQGFMGNGLIGPGLKGAGFVGNGILGLGGQGLAGQGYSSGGSFAVTSTSYIAPTGVSILAENLAIEGPLSVGGQLPFLGSVGVEGTLPASGSGAVSYGCGDGKFGITGDLGAHGVAGHMGVTSQYGPVASQYRPNLAGSGGMSGSNQIGYNPGLVNSGLNSPGQLGQGFVGNGLNGGLINLAGPGLNGAVLK